MHCVSVWGSRGAGVGFELDVGNCETPLRVLCMV